MSFSDPFAGLLRQSQPSPLGNLFSTTGYQQSGPGLLTSYLLGTSPVSSNFGALVGQGRMYQMESAFSPENQKLIDESMAALHGTPAGSTPGSTPANAPPASSAGAGGGMASPGVQSGPPPAAPSVNARVGDPQGVIPTQGSGLALGNATGLDWNQVNQWDPLIQQAADQWGVDPAIIKAAMAMESQGVANPDQSGAPRSSGLMQIERQWWDQSAAKLGYDLGTPEGQIGFFAALISGRVPEITPRGNTPLERYINNYQGPEAGQTDPNYTAAYQHDVELLMGMIGSAGSTGALPAAAPGVVPANVPPAVYQWTDDVATASETYGVPENILMATMTLSSGGQMVGPDGQIYTETDPYGNKSYGVMQLTPDVYNTAVCTADWCGHGDGSAETMATGINHNIYTPSGNIMMGARLLQQYHEMARGVAPQASEDQLWDMAASLFFTGNFAWDVGTEDGPVSEAAFQSANAAFAPQAQPTTTVQDPQTGVTTTVVPPGKVTGNALVDAAMTYQGDPYIWGAPYGAGGPGSYTIDPATGQATGFDCSGFVSYLAKTVMGVDLSTGSHQQWNDNQHLAFVPNNTELQPGDVMFFDTAGGTEVVDGNTASHVGIYIGYYNGHPAMINALNEESGVVISYLDDPYWQNQVAGQSVTYLGAKRLVA